MRAQEKLLMVGSWVVRRSEAYKIKADLAAVMSHSADYDFEVVLLLLLQHMLLLHSPYASRNFACYRAGEPIVQEGGRGARLCAHVGEALGGETCRGSGEFRWQAWACAGVGLLSARPACAPGKVSRDRGVALLWVGPVGEAVPPLVAYAACRNDARRCCLRAQLMVQTSKNL